MSKALEFPLKSASVPQLRKFALDELGLNLQSNLRKEDMLQRIVDSALSQDIDITDNSATETSKVKTETVARAGSPHADSPDKPLNGRVRIMIQKSDEKGGGRPVPVGFQGRMYTVPRGIPVLVPAGVEHILFNAVKDVVEDDLEKQTRTIRRVQSYPYQILEGHDNVKPSMAARAKRAEMEAMADVRRSA